MYFLQTILGTNMQLLPTFASTLKSGFFLFYFIRALQHEVRLLPAERLNDISCHVFSNVSLVTVSKASLILAFKVSLSWAGELRHFVLKYTLVLMTNIERISFFFFMNLRSAAAGEFVSWHHKTHCAFSFTVAILILVTAALSVQRKKNYNRFPTKYRRVHVIVFKGGHTFTNQGGTLFSLSTSSEEEMRDKLEEGKGLSTHTHTHNRENWRCLNKKLVIYIKQVISPQEMTVLLSLELYHFLEKTQW